MTTLQSITSPSSSHNAAHSNSGVVDYHLDFSRFRQHLVDVTLSFTAEQDAPALWLPAWIPGSYLMREFARNITAVHYQRADQDDNSIDDSCIKDSSIKNGYRAGKLSKNEWQLTEAKAGDKLQITYEVYCYDLSVRTAYVDQTRLYGNFTSLALAVEGLEHSPVSVTLSVPQDFYELNSPNSLNKLNNTDKKVKIACGLKPIYIHSDNTHYYHLQAENYHELIDYPFEIAPQDEFDFIVQDNKHNAIAHRFYISGKHSANLGRLQQDVQQICQTFVSWLGDAPFGGKDYDGYTFMTYASGNDYGGLEHINSTSLVTPRSDLPTAAEADEPSDSYQRLLGLCSHEYFHSWWVKTVRPDVMMNVDLRKEAYTPLLWVFEGFTSYIDDFMLQASGVVSANSYLKLLQAQINRYTQTHGRYLQSVAESSYDAWIKLYRADENTGNAGISYYNKGALVALCLDLTLMQHSDGKYRLFDVVKAFYQLAKQQGEAGDRIRVGMDNDNLEAVISQFMDKAAWQDFKAKYVDGVEELPIQELLEANGISLKIDEKDNTLPWGIAVSETPEGLQVNKVLRDSVASEAGISAKDVLVAIDGVKATKKQLQSVAESNLESVTCHVFRRDELMTFEVANTTQSGVTANPSLEKVSLSLNESGYEAWLKPKFR
ncbi:M61 family metallopeptidase [Psychrobacter phenylpyruvicus]|uniref:Predicted protease with the C-terminal PDZ domain n=1 Tax=Psychrobacter phenylpyruvicus TaxID=29432 RepID=A0A379LH18_9GAMM|nr:M61 family metallopeptidase [Psychrobacter phenylpyruvicus]SUD89856.1 Predicted protease with the C-terminal PDZ domain [Psychrobacter phenylpyruvicus]